MYVGLVFRLVFCQIVTIIEKRLRRLWRIRTAVLLILPKSMSNSGLVACGMFKRYHPARFAPMPQIHRLILEIHAIS